MFKAADSLLYLGEKVPPPWINGPDGFIVRLEFLQDELNRAVLQMREDIKIRELANAESGYASFDYRMAAIAPETPFWTI